MKRGYTQVYTGNGKGKTTAAFGLALRAAGAGFKVFIAQFVKGMKYSELESVKRFSDLIDLKQYGRGGFSNRDPIEEDFQLAKAGLDEVSGILESGEYQLVIMDEANIAVHYDLFTPQELIQLIDKRPEQVELVITGRHAHKMVLDRADLVSEVRDVKHYYANGVQARTGIDK